MKSTVTGVALAVTGMFSAVARGDLAVDVVSGSTYIRGSWANFGYSLHVSEPVRVDALGLWDMHGNGLAEEHPVGLWDADGNLLAQALVNNSGWVSPSVNSNHAWRFADISPVDLAPGEYKLGAFYPTTADAFVAAGDIPAQILFAPQVAFGQSFVTTGGTEFFAEPTSTTSFNPGFFGPNASFSPIPEPATLAGLMIVGLLGLRRRS